jgi:hypothetical protein
MPTPEQHAFFGGYYLPSEAPPIPFPLTGGTMFQKIRTTVMLDAKTTRTVLDTVEDREEDMASEHERLSAIARQNNNIQSVEEGTHALVVIYRHGTVKVYNWVAVPE